MCLLPSRSRSPPGQTPARLCLVPYPSLDRQSTITGSSLIKPQTPVLRSPLLSPLRVIQGEAELDPTSRNRAPKGTSGTLPPVQEEPCLAYSGRHRAWRAQGQLPPPQGLGHKPIRVGSDSVGPSALPWKENQLLASSLQLARSKSKLLAQIPLSF